jgi:SPP1 gp7 family putative phage head morphogenesis protein
VNVYTGRIREALRGAMDTRALAEAWLALYPGAVAKARDMNPVLVQFLQRAYTAIVEALQAVLGRLWPEAWVLGQQAAEAVVKGGEADWRGWAPGDHRAAEAIAGAELRRLLEESGIRVKSIAETRLEELADVLEQTLASDVTAITAEGPLPPRLSVGDLARQLRDVLDRPQNAELVAWTEISRAQGEAARSVYAEAGYPLVDWITAMDARVCPACAAAMASNPHALGAPPIVPMHPRCRCAEIPVLSSLAGVP